MSFKQQKGFTLVEIAIVLVIVGLLIGGVLKGQEMITNAKLKRIESDNAGIAAAMFSYQDRYLQLPGDDSGAADRFTVYAAADPVNGGGGALGGSGTVNGDILVNAGGTYAPGNSVGTQTVNNITFAADSTFQAEVDLSTDSADLLIANGTATLDGTLDLDVGFTTFDFEPTADSTLPVDCSAIRALWSQAKKEWPDGSAEDESSS